MGLWPGDPRLKKDQAVGQEHALTLTCDPWSSPQLMEHNAQEAETTTNNRHALMEVRDEWAGQKFPPSETA